MREPVIVEICVDSLESALAAQRGGAHRIELCSGLIEGGTTPSAGLISSVRREISIPMFVMVRPRAGDFCYRNPDFETMKQDVLTAKQLGADGVVFGILREDGRIDIERTRLLVDLARPLKVTFHRAFDMSRNLGESLEAVINAGPDRVLTSGGEARVEEGISAVRALVQAAAGRVAIMAGAGITESNAQRVLAETGTRELHASTSMTVPSGMLYRNTRISMGRVKGQEYQYFAVSEEKVRSLVRAATDGLGN